ncbi:MAG TPA: FtsX-like permease family protein, partial [Puia sp.]|nr:FtsX-like permease family protein [Puia sp.]
LYRVIRIGKHPTDRDYRTGVPIPVTNTLRTDFPQLVHAGAIDADGDVQVIVPAEKAVAPRKFKEAQGVFFAEPQFFQMFDFPLAAGSIPEALEAPYTVLLTKDLANKYFGDWKTAMGRTLIVDGVSEKVTGILENPPANTDFPLKAVQSYETMRHLMSFDDWGSIDDQNYCFVELGPTYLPERFLPLLDRFKVKYIQPADSHYDLSLQPLNEMHYDGRLGTFTGRTFSKDLIFALSLIGLFLLIVACVNFINLTTAQAITRAREVGVRKVLGGRRSQLIVQFLGETGITSLFALLAAAVVVLACIPAVNNLLDIHLSFSVLYTGRWLEWMLCLLVGVILLSGFYPAMVLSGFTPVTVLKGAMGASRGKGISFRRALVVFQFVIAQALIIATLIVASQMDYFRTADMGFKKEAIINASFPNDSLGLTKMDALRHDLQLMPGVQQVSFSSGTPATGGGYFTDLQTAANHTNDRDMVVNVKLADSGFFRLYQLPLVAGRVYFPSDSIREYVVNETLLRNLRIPHARDAIGQTIKVAGRAGQIVGVVKDFHVNSLRDPIGPVVMMNSKRAYGFANISVDLRDAKPVLAAMGKIWNRYFPDFTFEYSFLDQDIADFYKQENQLSILYKLFSGIAIFISCLGLYGLISFMAVQRNKEIGIRKVLGAPIRDILFLLSKEFTILIAIAFLIATPVAWYFMHRWLEQYTYRISIGLWFFVATIVGSLVIAWLTVGYTAIKAALANPVKSLRSE